MRGQRTVTALLAGLILSTMLVQAITALVPAFPAPRPEPVEALAQVQRALGYPEKTPAGTVVNLIWTTADAFQADHSKAARFRWLNAPEEWAWFVTRFDPQPPTGTAITTPVRVDRIRTNGLVAAGVAPLSSSLSIAPASEWDAEHLPQSTAIDAIGKALSALGPTDPHRPRVVVGASWSTAAHFRPHIVDGCSYHWDEPLFEWAWFITMVERDTTTPNGRGDRVVVLRVLNNGVVHQPGFSRT